MWSPLGFLSSFQRFQSERKRLKKGKGLERGKIGKCGESIIEKELGNGEEGEGVGDV